MNSSIKRLAQTKVNNYNFQIDDLKERLNTFESASTRISSLLKELGISEDESIDGILEEFDFDNQRKEFIELIKVLTDVGLIQDSSYWVSLSRLNDQRIERGNSRYMNVSYEYHTDNENQYKTETIEGTDKQTEIIWYLTESWDDEGNCRDHLVQEQVAKITELTANSGVWVSSQGFFSDSRSILASWSKLNF